MIKKEIVCNVIHVVVVLDHVLGVERDDQMQNGAEKEGNIEADEDEENLVRHGCSTT
jgi:hypothetical protein